MCGNKLRINLFIIYLYFVYYKFDKRKVTPPVVTPPNAGIYLLPNSALGYLGPIGTYGPLSSLGPLGIKIYISFLY